MDASARYDPAVLRDWAGRVLLATGAPDDVAEAVTGSLVDADRTGHRGHGLRMLPTYLADIDRGALVPAARPAVLAERPAHVTIDGGHGFGHHTMRWALDRIIAKASHSGVAAGHLVRAGHAGRLGGYALTAAERGFAVLILVGTVADDKDALVAPYGGTQPLLGTNPIAYGCPGDPPFVLDLATSAMAYYDLVTIARAGGTVPAGVLLDAAGQPTDRAAALLEGGVMRPFGGHKGYGLSLAAGLLAGAPPGGDRERPERPLNGAFLLAIDQRDSASRRDIDAALWRIRTSRPLDAQDPLLVPGDRARAHADHADRAGLTLATEILDAVGAWFEQHRREPPSPPEPNRVAASSGTGIQPLPDQAARLTRLADLDDVRRAARRVLPNDVWDFVDGGSGAELTLDDSLGAWRRARLVPRVLAGVTDPDPSCELLGVRSAAPFAIAPMAYQQLVHPDGEVAAARAAAAAGVPYVLSMMSGVPVERVTATGAKTWFQLYWLRDRGYLCEVLARAETAGCVGFMLTVDMPVMGRRTRDVRRGFALPAGLAPAHLPTTPDTYRSRPGESGVAAYTAAAFEPAAGWDDLAWLVGRTGRPVAVKGLLDPDDADLAVRAGAATVVVSTHGGRQLDGAIAAVDAFPAVRDVVAGRSRLLLDSGVRGGVDVLKALALGADGVLVGRPALWGLAVAGCDGVTAVLGLLRTELVTAMALAGCADTAAAARLRVV